MSVIREIQEDLEASARRLFMEYHSQLLVEARALCADSASAEDLVMITLETYFAKPEKFDPSKGELLTWLKAVMRNHFRKSLRRKSHIDTIFLPADDLQTVAERLQSGDGQHDLDKAESDELIRRAVASLSPKVRDAVILHYFKDQSVERTASVLGISVDAAKNRLFCARQILHRRLKGRFGKSLAVILVAFLSLVSAAAVATLPAFEPLRATVAGWFGSDAAQEEDIRGGDGGGDVGGVVGGVGVSPAQTEDGFTPDDVELDMVGVPPPTESEPAIAISNEQETQEITTQETQPQEKQTMKIGKTVATVVLGATTAIVGAIEADGVTLSVDKVQQRYPWNGLVDIDYTIASDPAAPMGVDDNLEVLMVDKSVSPAVTNRAISFLQAPLPLTDGKHRITWDANADGVTNQTDRAVFLMKIAHYVPAYMVIDVSGGPDTDTYPVSFCNGEPRYGFNTEEYKGDKIVLRRIHPGSYMAGSPINEANHDGLKEKQHRVALTQPFYIGLFEITQQQYLNVMGGDNPAKYQGDAWKFRPVEQVCYNDIRGTCNTKTHSYDWPWTNSVSSASFMGKLRAKCKSKGSEGNYTETVDGFDLPTEFQWEYACRAGTTGAFNTTNEYDNTNGSEQTAQLKLLGRYTNNKTDEHGNSDAHTVVGSYEPNQWGLYDMHGNVWEWCRDHFAEDPTQLIPKQYVDPVGPVNDDKLNFVARGGSWYTAVGNCRSAYRDYYPSTDKRNYGGFRLSRTLP